MGKLIQLELFGRTITIKPVSTPPSNLDERTAEGVSVYRRGHVIEIDLQDDAVDIEERQITLLHEWMHKAYETSVGSADHVKDEEGHVEIISKAVLQLLKQWHKLPRELEFWRYGNNGKGQKVRKKNGPRVPRSRKAGREALQGQHLQGDEVKAEPVNGDADIN